MTPKGEPEATPSPVLWEYDKYTEIQLQTWPTSGSDWGNINTIMNRELRAGRPVVVTPPKEVSDD